MKLVYRMLSMIWKVAHFSLSQRLLESQVDFVMWVGCRFFFIFFINQFIQPQGGPMMVTTQIVLELDGPFPSLPATGPFPPQARPV